MAEPVGGRITSWLVLVLIPGCQKAALPNSDGGEISRAGSSRSLYRGSSPRPPAPFRLWRSHKLIQSASTSLVVRGVPRDLSGNTAGEVVRQASTMTAMAGTSPAGK